MNERDCTAFLQWCLPQLRLRWAGFRKVRKQVCRRLRRRIATLDLADLAAYQAYLASHAEEWRMLNSLCTISIARFYRDRAVFDTLCSAILPALAQSAMVRGDHELRCWSAGCCSGEEPYTVQILWQLCVAPQVRGDLRLRMIATDRDSSVLQRARQGRYPASALKDLPPQLCEQAFSADGVYYAIRAPFTLNVTFVEQDIREQMPPGSFHLILCRNLVFTYFECALQRDLLDRIAEKLVPGGVIVIGTHETIPPGRTDLMPYANVPCIYQKGNGTG